MDELSLFASDGTEEPLAQKMRPKSLEDLVGQKHFLNDNFRRLLATDRWVGFIFWGPPGVGKTSLALVIAGLTKRRFHVLSAVTAGVKDIREILDISRKDMQSGRQAHILFVDEIHRLNKAQQDVLLPYLEDGSIRFIGSTTENPSFEVNNAILSRCLTLPFQPLTEEDLICLVRKSEKAAQLTEGAILKIAALSGGDARRCFNLLEYLSLSHLTAEKITEEAIEALAKSQSLYYDRHSDYHHDNISALIKSIRGSDPDAAIYYMARMLEGGEDPVFIVRRLIILASEDIGNANPMALVLATNALTAVHAIGMPEARIVLAQTVTYLACCEKSNRSYMAILEAEKLVKEKRDLQVPMHLRNAPTQAMKQWGHGKNYQYPHNDKRGWVAESYLPDAISTMRFYQPSEHGSEKKIKDFLKARQDARDGL